MRSVSHLVAGELAKSVKGEPWTKRFYAKVARRPDDVLETLGYYLSTYRQPRPPEGDAAAHKARAR
jgi:60 kDa SS-A/Ro ribonucleoprotein